MEHKIGDQNLELHFGPKIQSAVHLIYFLSMGLWGNGGGSVGRAVASITRDPQSKFQHWQIYLPNCTLKINDKNEEKEAGNGLSLKKYESFPKLVISFKTFTPKQSIQSISLSWGRGGGLVDRAADSGLYDPSSNLLGEKKENK